MAEGRSLATQTINQISRQITDLETSNSRVRRCMHERPDSPTNTGHDCTQGRLDFPQVPPEPHCALRHDVEPGEGLGLCAARSLRGPSVAGTRSTQRALPHLGGDESFN